VADYNDLLVAGQDFAYSRSIACVVLKLQVKYTSLQAKLKFICKKHEKEREERKLANEERARVFEELGRLREKAVQLDALLGDRDRRVHELMENSRGMGHWMRLSSRFAGAE
jgi:hypothetical protein